MPASLHDRLSFTRIGVKIVGAFGRARAREPRVQVFEVVRGRRNLGLTGFLPVRQRQVKHTPCSISPCHLSLFSCVLIDCV